jgi:hypothetical protein
MVDVALLAATDPPIMLRAVAFTRNECPPRYTCKLDGVIGPSALRELTLTFAGPRRQFSLSMEWPHDQAAVRQAFGGGQITADRLLKNLNDQCGASCRKGVTTES